MRIQIHELHHKDCGGSGTAELPEVAETAPRADKLALVYKLLGTGCKCNSEEQKRRAIAWAYMNIEPIDHTIIGLHPRNSDQVTETT